MKEYDFKIEKGIPPTPARKSGRPATVYPFPSMEAGDSFFVEDDKRFNSIRTCSLKYGKAHGMKFHVDRVDGGVRCWRIA